MNAEPCCANCRFFKASGETGGYCRRYPPQIYVNVATVGYRHGEHDESINSTCNESWPEVQDGTWCGEHSPKPALQLSDCLVTPLKDVP